MIRIHCTKKLLAKLPLTESGLISTLPARGLRDRADDGEIELPPSSLGDWHANLLTIQRRNCLLFVHDQSRFPVFIPALNRRDLRSLNDFFDDALLNTLLKCGVSHEALETASRHLMRLQFDSVCDRSVQGAMNQMAQEIHHHILYNNVDIRDVSGYRVGAFLADRPRTVKGRRDYIWPIAEFTAMLEGLSDSALEEAARPKHDGPLPENVVDMAKFRRS